jgi:UDP-N-acetylmuramyl pentapeptide phosphotransferase/UDP-N-acetylglucosamine-1-phosphate transferase
MHGGELSLIAAAAAAICAGLILGLRPLLIRHALAQPNARSSHREPTPQGGGIAVIGAFLAVAIVAAIAGRLPGNGLLSLAMVLAATIIVTAVGAADDLHTIAVAPRLLLQAVAVVVMLAALPADLHIIEIVPWWVERTLLLLGCLWFVNLTNFMDGLDWMTVAEVLPLSTALVILGLFGALPMEATVAAAALGGATLGFAPFNRPVARLFLGDVGSLPIGLLLAWMLVVLAGQGHVFAAALLPLYYLADTTTTLLRRIYNREAFWQAHRSHFYQRATHRGFSVTEIVTRVFIVNIGLATLAIASVFANRLLAALAGLCGAAMVIALLAAFSRGRS